MAEKPQFDISPEKEAGMARYFYSQLFVDVPLVDKNRANLESKTAIVTGSNTGIGLEVARQLLDLGLSKLILAVRNVTKGRVAAKDLSQGRTPGSFHIEVWELDLSSYDSIVAFAKRADSLARLDLAILNAALYKLREEFHPSTHVETDVQINYLSNALLACLLLPKLKPTPGKLSSPGRLVLVSSDTAGWVKFKERASRPILDAFKKENAAGKKWDMQERYGTTKLLGQLFLTKLAERVPASVVTVAAANPGFCKGSHLARESNGTLLGVIVTIMQRLIGRPCHKAARPIIHAAVGFQEEAHGQYIEDGLLRPKAPLIYQPEGAEIATQLWEETMTELSFANVREIIVEVTK